jgi:peptidoglycan/LPS O-acetylase OafA/YrhL
LLISIIRAHVINWGNYSFLKKVKGFYPIILYTRGPASLLRTIAAFLLGIFAFFIYRFQGNKESYLKYSRYLIIPLFALLFINNSDIIIIILMPALILYITQANFLNRLLSSKPVHFAGLISYSLYLNHFLFINTYSTVSELVKINNDLFSLFYVLVSTFIFSAVTYYVIERPGLALFKYRFKTYRVNNIYLPPEKRRAPILIRKFFRGRY